MPKGLIEASLAASEGQSVYATTKAPKMHTILPRHVFTTLGGSYPSKQQPEAALTLFVRSV